MFNTRRTIFADVKVRRALSALLDFGWINRTFFAGRSRRIDSFWQDSELSSIGIAAGPKERAQLARFSDSVLPDVMGGNYRADDNNGDGNYRSLIKNARDLFIRAGYSFSNGIATEQWLRWGTESRYIQGSFNYAGANNPAIDAVIDDMLQQTERGAFIASVRALDRRLISGCYFIPLYYLPEQQIAHGAASRKRGGL